MVTQVATTRWPSGLRSHCGLCPWHLSRLRHRIPLRLLRRSQHDRVGRPPSNWHLRYVTSNNWRLAIGNALTSQSTRARRLPARQYARKHISGGRVSPACMFYSANTVGAVGGLSTPHRGGPPGAAHPATQPWGPDLT